MHKNKSNFFSIKLKASIVVLNLPQNGVKCGIIIALESTLESFNTKNRYKKLDFLAWFGTTCDSFLLVLKKPLFAVIGIRVVLFILKQLFV